MSFLQWYLTPNTTTTVSDQSALAVQGRQIEGEEATLVVLLTWRVEGATLGFWWSQWYQRRMRNPRGGRGDDCDIVTIARSQAIWCINATFWRENQQEVLIYGPLFQMMNSCDVSLSSFRCSSSNRTHKLSLSLPLPFYLKQVLIYLVLRCLCYIFGL